MRVLIYTEDPIDTISCGESMFKSETWMEKDLTPEIQEKINELLEDIGYEI